MPSLLRTGAWQYWLLIATALILVALVVFALGRLVTDQLDSACGGDSPPTTTAANATRC